MMHAKDVVDSLKACGSRAAGLPAWGLWLRNRGGTSGQTQAEGPLSSCALTPYLHSLSFEGDIAVWTLNSGRVVAALGMKMTVRRLLWRMWPDKRAYNFLRFAFLTALLSIAGWSARSSHLVVCSLKLAQLPRNEGWTKLQKGRKLQRHSPRISVVVQY